jgi:glycosyltransferase involved in cell wall biosynthesis
VRVLRVCPAFEPPAAALLPGAGARDPVGGLQSHAAGLSAALDRLGVGQTVVTSRPPGAGRRERLGARAGVVRVGLRRGSRRWVSALLAATVAPALAARADVVHLHFSADVAFVPVAVAAARLHRLPLVVTVHCSLRHTLDAADPKARRLRTVGIPAERWATGSAAAVIALSRRTREQLERDGLEGRRLHVIPSGVRTGSPARPPEDPFPGLARPRVLFAGRLEGEKDVATLVRAFARIAHPGAELVLVGDGSARRPLERLARELGVGSRVRVTGYVPQPQVAAALAHADVLALPSRFEELGTAVLEAMHAGVAVVASDVGGLPEAVGGAGVLVPAGDPAALAAALDRLLGDAALREQLGAAGRRRARGYGWDELAGQVLAVYESVADIA